MVIKGKVKCPSCGSTATVKMGKYRTKKWGLKDRCRCKDCATSFYEDYESMGKINLGGDK